MEKVYPTRARMNSLWTALWDLMTVSGLCLSYSRPWRVVVWCFVFCWMIPIPQTYLTPFLLDICISYITSNCLFLPISIDTCSLSAHIDWLFLRLMTFMNIRKLSVYYCVSSRFLAASHLLSMTTFFLPPHIIHQMLRSLILITYIHHQTYIYVWTIT